MTSKTDDLENEVKADPQLKEMPDVVNDKVVEKNKKKKLNKK